MQFTLKQIAVVVFLGAVIICSHLGAYYQGKKDGVQAYHDQCFSIGGFIIDEVGHVVKCAPLGSVPKEELKNFKDNI